MVKRDFDWPVEGVNYVVSDNSFYSLVEQVVGLSSPCSGCDKYFPLFAAKSNATNRIYHFLKDGSRPVEDIPLNDVKNCTRIFLPLAFREQGIYLED